MIRRQKHEGQLDRWARLALRGSLLAGAIAVMMALSNGPQKVGANSDSDEGVNAPVNAPADISANEVDKQIIKQLQKNLDAKACPMCGSTTGCCCGDPANCKCGAATQGSCGMGK